MNYKHGAKIFYIQHDKSNKTSGVCFRCINNKCKLKYPIRINSLYSKFPFIRLKDLMEIIHYFLCLEMSANKAFKYLNDNKKIKIFLTALLKVYSELRLIIYLYMKILYESEAISTKNNRDYFSVDESLINHINNKKIWLLGIINNTSKEFSIEVSYNRDSGTLANTFKNI